MDFEISHSFTSSPEELAGVLLDRSFQDSLSDLEGLAAREVLSQEEEEGRVVRRTRYELDVQVSGVAQRFLGNSTPAWVEVATWDPSEMTWSWTIEPEVAAELLDARGATRLTGNDGRSVRTVNGAVKVKVPFYGGRIEGWVVDGLERAYDEEARRIEDRLQG